MKKFLSAALCLLFLISCAEKPQLPPSPSISPSPIPSSTAISVSSVPPTSPSPAPTPDPIPDGPFAALLSGDTSDILDPEDRAHMDWMFSNVTSSSFNPLFEISSLWSYTLLDLDGDGAEELFLRPKDAWYSHFIFKSEANGLRLLEQKSVGMYYWVEPLTDGRLLQTMQYDGMYTYTIYHLGARSDGDDVWTHRWEEPLYYNGVLTEELDLTEPISPAWTHNGQSLTEEEFNEQFQQEVLELLVTDWHITTI